MSPSRARVKALKFPWARVLWCAMVSLWLCPFSVQAEPLKITLFPGDSHTVTSLQAAKSLKQELDLLGVGKVSGGRYDEVSIHAYPTQDIQKRDIQHLRESKLVFIRVGERHVFEAVKSEIAEVIRRGGKVYALGGEYTVEHEQVGIIQEEKINAYFRTRFPENLKNMILYTLRTAFAFDVSYKEPVDFPEFGIYEPETKQIFQDFEEYRKVYQTQTNRNRQEGPWIGVLFYRTSIESGQMKSVDAVLKSLEGQGYNVLPVFGHPTEAALRKMFLSSSFPRVRLIVAVGAKMAQNPDLVVPLLSRLNVPVINAVAISGRTEEEWRRSPAGLDIIERGWQIAGPEMAGIIQPTVIASKEQWVDPDTGLDYPEYRPIKERIWALTERVKAWIKLQDKPNKDKRIAVIYYNYPPGKQSIGAAYLNVLPESLYEILQRLKAEGYDASDQEIDKEKLFNDILNHGRNIGKWAPGELDRLVRSGKPVLIPLETYKKWFAALPEGFKNALLKSWGPIEQNKIMIWRDRQGRRYLVIPVVQYGNILFTPQPSRGWEQDEHKLYHDVLLPPHHQYVAFYLWLKNVFQADAVAHIGTHGTHEWLPGKEIGFTDEDPPEVLLKELPNIYPYNVDNVAEGIQAKRRGMAVVVDHMTPPFDRAGLNAEMKSLASLVNDYRIAREKNPALAAAKLEEINDLAKKIGMTKDMGVEIITARDIEEVDDYISGIAEKQAPFGLHTFGKAPDGKYRRSTAEAIMSSETGFAGEERERRISELEDRIAKSGQWELDAFIAALSGKYVPAGLGGDPIRSPASLPTGNNFYAFDPTLIPARSTYETGTRLSKDLIEGYKQRHGMYPDKLTFNLWAEETIRHEGVMESQIMHLLGVRPKWDQRGRVTGVEAIPREELGRQRIDVVIIPSGLYRDVFSNLIALLDNAVTAAREQQEEDNLVRDNTMRTKAMLMRKGVSADKAERLASVRIFTVPSGAYGTNLANVIPKSNTWDHEHQVADVYFMRMSHMFGQGFWGDKEEQGREDMSRALLKGALSGTKMTVHSRSSNLYATLDNDDFFQFLGGTAMAIRAVDGKTPEVYVTSMSDPGAPKQETLEKVMGREMRSRYLNPEWIKGMMKGGYAGGRFIDKMVEHLWGWQVTVPEVVDEAKWNEIYEIYILDRNGLDIKGMFRQAGNMHAYQSLTARMLETVRKGYWNPDKKVRDTLVLEYTASVNETGLACCDHTCNNPQLTAFTAKALVSVPGLSGMAKGFLKALDTVKYPGGQERQKNRGSAQRNGGRQPPHASEQAPAGKGITVTGYEMQEVGTSATSSAPIPYLFLIGFIVFVGLIAIGFRGRSG